MQELQALWDAQTHDELMQLMKTTDVSGIFEEYNSRILVSSFMLFKFKEVYDIDDELFNLSNVISNAMVNLDFMTISQNYKNYFDKFTQWREKDIQEMKINIQNQIDACRDTATSPRDEADRTWNECINESVKLMSKKIENLDQLAKTPPKY